MGVSNINMFHRSEPLAVHEKNDGMLHFREKFQTVESVSAIYVLMEL